MQHWFALREEVLQQGHGKTQAAQRESGSLTRHMQMKHTGWNEVLIKEGKHAQGR